MMLRPLVLAILMLLSACGNKGALYLPQQTTGNSAANGSQPPQK